MSDPVTIRDPLWDTIRLDRVAVRIVDAQAFQRLRHIKQLGHAHLVYPGATHTRFDHALGVYHLARQALGLLERHGALRGLPHGGRLVPLAGLLHDIGHYPFSHAIEELQAARIPGHHEELVGRFLADPDVTAALASVSEDAAGQVESLIRGSSDHALRGLVSGSLDLDKIDYLKRDAMFCGVPYGEVDVDRLLHALTVAADPATGRPEIAVREKGVAALESLLFAKYQMFRNVYWHHAVRAATVLYKRVVGDALDGGLLRPDELVGETDEGVLYRIVTRASNAPGEAAERISGWVTDLRNRRLPKRAAEIVAAELEGGVAGWLEEDSPFKRRVEDAMARELGVPDGHVFLDYPEKTAMFGLDLLVERRDGRVERVGPEGQAGLIGLPRVANELYRTARVLRLFTHGARIAVPPAALAGIASLDHAAVLARLESRDRLLQN
ncbi:MAG: HD domain-containing protein [Gemmatimonadetes bacterium]|nr:HD domain-containing protein [Gemmatimonadota bacterium]